MKDKKSRTNDISTLIKRWGYKKNENILIIVTLPLPIGGVSIHAMRLIPLLNHHGITPDVFDPSKSKFPGYNFSALLYKILIGNYQQIHIHSSSSQILSAVMLTHKMANFDIFFHVHNPVLFCNTTLAHKKMIQLVLKKSKRIISVSEESKNKILDIIPEVSDRMVIQSAVIPPDPSRLHELEAQYPERLKVFLKEHHPLLIMNAFRIHFHEGIDVYGIDLSIELLIRLAGKYPRIGLIIALGTRNKIPDYLKSLIKQLDEHNLKTHLYIIDSIIEIWPLFTRCDIMLRPTLYDGSSLSVTEAVQMGCPVVASDAAQRLPECSLFKSRDIDDYERVCLKVLKNSNHE